MTILGKFAATDAVLIGTALLTLWIACFPDDDWQKKMEPVFRWSIRAIFIGLGFEIFFALLSIWGLH